MAIEQTLSDGYCALSSFGEGPAIMCGPEITEVVTEFYQSANATTNGELVTPDFPRV